MDPVNKWLFLVAAFMIALVVALAKVGGEGRYEMKVSSYSETHEMVYILDTKTGELKSKLVPYGEHIEKNAAGEHYSKDKWITVREKDAKDYRYSRYSNSSHPVSFNKR